MSVQSKDGLNGDVDAAKLVLLKHDLAHLFPVLGRVHRRFGEHDLAAFGADLELFVKGVVP